ncbi:hypothetical protein KY345_03070 [Candidatus Woesearchaeota archaeon]|nr:hypothetical protein [Candidatus Woesearchaeota archaeon]
MPEISKEELGGIMDKFSKEIATEMGERAQPVKAETEGGKPEGGVKSREYSQFKSEYLPPQLSWYEKACNFTEKLVKLTPDKKTGEKYKDAITTCHLNITPAGANSLAIMLPASFAFLAASISFMLTGDIFFPLFSIAIAGALYLFFRNYPISVARKWRMDAGSQMVMSVFYVVTYMRHTPNLELAVDFAAEHLAPPLALDFKKMLWDVETEKCKSIKESLDNYLETWRDYNNDFIEAFHLIESSLLEGAEDRRITMLDKSLAVMLDGTYERMLHYAQGLKSPMTTLNMLGVILPVLGLVVLPLVVSFMEGVSWTHISAIYNIGFPAAVLALGMSILATRPSGYGKTDISNNPELKKYKNFIFNLGGKEIKIPPLYLSIIVAVLLLLIGFSPLILRIVSPRFDIDIGDKFKLFDWKCPAKNVGCLLNEEIGPFGLGATVLSLFIVAAVGLAIGLYFKNRSQNVIKIRRQSKQLEKEFASAIFQLGNRLADGLPAEVAFGKVADAMKGTISGSFFEQVSSNITRLGMSVEKAIFDPKVGVLRSYPSNMIESSMKVLTESSKKGPAIAAQALMNVSSYIKQMHKVEERLIDLLAETISSIKAQIKFLTPVITAIVIGITSMVSSILGRLSSQMSKIAEQGAEGAASGLMGLFGDGIPTFYFQAVVGIYVVQVVYILTIMANGIENGQDKLSERFELGKNLLMSTATYCVLAAVIIILFNLIAGAVMR